MSGYYGIQPSDKKTLIVDMTTPGPKVVYVVQPGEEYIISRMRITTNSLVLDGTTGTISVEAGAVELKAEFQTNATAAGRLEHDQEFTKESRQIVFVAGDEIKITVQTPSDHSDHITTITFEGDTNRV